MAEPLDILIVEDESLIAMMLQDYLEDLGHRVAGTADSVASALSYIDQVPIDLAIIDIALRNRELCWPVADRLADKGIALLISSGGIIDEIPSRHARAIMLQKPFTIETLVDALTRAIGRK